MKILKIKNTVKKPKSKFGKFLDEHIYILLAFICSAFLMMLVYYCFDVIPFGIKTVLRMDLFHQYGPLFAEFVDRLKGFKSFVYSWNTGGGGAFLGNYYNYLSSPVGDLIALFAGHNNIPEAIGVMVLVKNALASSTLAYYLKKSMKKNDFTITAFGIMYSFCGFFIAYYWNIMWIDAMYILPLAVLGIEKIIDERKCKLYTLALAFAFFSSYYMAYMLCIFAVVYFLVYFFSNYSTKDSIIAEKNEGKTIVESLKNIYNNRFLHSGVSFAISSVLGVGLVAFALIPTYLCLKTCSATSGTFPDEISYYNNIFDFIANHIASVEPTIRSSGDTVLPNVYCGMLSVILIPLYAFCNNINYKEKIAHVVLLAFFFVGFNVNYANYIFHAMHFPNDLPYRFSFLYCFVLVTMAFKVLINIKSISTKAIVGSGMGVLLFIALAQKTEMANISDNTVYISIAFTAIYVVVLSLMKKKEFAQSTIALLLMCCVFAEAAVSNTDHFKITQEKPNFVSGYSDFRTLKGKLDELSDEKFYRMELSYINTLMDASWFNYNGVSVFSSMAYELSANLQDNLGMDSNYINSYVYHPQTPIYNAMMSLKYIVKNDEYKVNEKLLEQVTTCGKFEAYENKYNLPLAYMVDKYITDWDYSLENPFDVQNDYWYKATGVNDVLKPVYPSDYSADNISESYIDLEDTSIGMYKTISDEAAELVLNYTITESQNVYVYFEGSGVSEINVFTQNDVDLTQSVDEAYILDCGYLQAGEILTVKIPVEADEDTGMVECYVTGLDMEAFEAGYEILSQNGMTITDFDETDIKGTVTAPADKILYTSINYDEGWTVTVDGKNAETVKIGDALLGVKLSEGEHTIEFKYHAKGLTLGLGISAGCAIILIAITLLGFITKKKKKAVKVPVFEENTSAEPRGLDVMMAEDLGEDATVEQAEALLEVPDEYEKNKPDTAPTIQRAEDILNTQKLDLKEILEKLNEEENKE